jgi:anti-sigma B factor antagonist
MVEKPSLTVRHEDRITIIGFNSPTLSFDEAQVEEINGLFERAIDESQDMKFIVNFEGVNYMSSNVLGMLVNSLMKIVKKGGHMRLASVDREIYQLFEITGLKKLFKCNDTLSEAKKALEAEAG